MMDELIKTLRADWPEILVEKHWMMDSDAIEKQRSEAADAIEVLREALERIANLKWDTMTQGCNAACEASKIALAALQGQANG